MNACTEGYPFLSVFTAFVIKEAPTAFLNLNQE